MRPDDARAVASRQRLVLLYRHATRDLQAVGWVQWQGGVASDSCQPGNAFSAAGWALVNFCLALGNRLGIGRAVRVAAALALGLRQGSMKPLGEAGKIGSVGVGHPAIVSAYLLRATLTGTRLAAGLAAAFTDGLATRLMAALTAGFVVATFLGAACARFNWATGLFNGLFDGL